MAHEDREWLLEHLAEQARYLSRHVKSARSDPHALIVARDAVFTIRETLDTLGVPHALDSNAAWSQATGTPDERPPQERA